MTTLYKNRKIGLIAAVCGLVFLSSCKRSFLKPDPLSIFAPSTTFTTESGLQAVLAECDRHIRTYWTYYSAVSNSVPIGTEYQFSDLAVYGKTDVSPSDPNFQIATGLTPIGGYHTTANDGGYIGYFWDETYNAIKYANTILTYIDQVSGLDSATKNAYIGRAYFHRAFGYMQLVFEFGDVPLVTQIISTPKQNYRSTKKAAILDMITKDMEFAVQWVPEQTSMNTIGMVNKGGCRMLLAKCYLATGQYAKAQAQCDALINTEGYSLMTSKFGTFNPGGEPKTWPITDNVIWDLHRPENKLIPTNKEVIMGMVDEGSTTLSFIPFSTMRIFGPFWNSTGTLKTPDGQNGGETYARNNGNYNVNLDFLRAVGRGIGTWRPTYYAQHTMWRVNGVEDTVDLRHNSQVGNWGRMDSIKYNHKGSSWYGKNFQLHSPSTGALLCTDTIRDWFDWPHYKIFLNDVVAEADQTATQFNGASNGGNADWYLYRLAEAYLLRAEAKFYLGDATAKDDVNAVRIRAHCSQLYTNNVTIGDIMDERARELYLEEWRHMELSRVSYCLALSGKPDEWGNTYNVDTYDKQSGTDLAGGSYWYKRVVLDGGMYNKGTITSNGQNFNYTMDKHNLYYPIPNAAIIGNNKGKLMQNFGYDGYDASTPEWDNWQDAVKDESSH
ncbi:MAG TPA: RagB/SusD family nutrient uptake outer membrane protein [Puia sp.]|nr:RagB/SusD family nutrient uptake outer membrane protein [Puia sp.]